MFGSRKKELPKADATKIDTVIGCNTSLRGNLDIEGSVRVDGRLEGMICAQGDVTVGEKGNVTAEIRARTVEIAGLVQGNVIAAELVLTATGQLCGDVKAEKLIIQEGARFEGTSTMLSSDSVLAVPVAGEPVLIGASAAPGK